MVQHVLYITSKIHLPYIKHGTELWFKAKDIAILLDYENTRQPVIEHVPDEDKKILANILDRDQRSPYAQSHQIYVNLNGLYIMITKSQKPGAKMLQKWLDKELGIK